MAAATFEIACQRCGKPATLTIEQIERLLRADEYHLCKWCRLRKSGALEASASVALIACAAQPYEPVYFDTLGYEPWIENVDPSNVYGPCHYGIIIWEHFPNPDGTVNCLSKEPPQSEDDSLTHSASSGQQ